MSKISKALVAHEVGREMIAPGITLESSLRGVESLDAVRYEVGLQLKSSVVVLEDLQRQTGWYMAVGAAKRRLIEEVFGEFRLPLLRAREAFYNRDVDLAGKLLEDIYDQMFPVL